MGQVAVGELLILDALLDVLIVKVEIVEAVVAAIALVVVGDDRLERGLLALGVVPVVLFFLDEVLLNLPDVPSVFLAFFPVFFGRVHRRREHGGDLERNEIGVGGLALGLERLENLVVFDRVVDRGGGKQGVEFTPGGGGGVFFEDRFDNRSLGGRRAHVRLIRALPFVVIDVKAQNVAILDRVRDGIFVEAFLKQVLGGLQGGHLSLGPLDGGVVLEDRSAGETEELGVREERLDSPVVFAELRAMAFVKDEDHAPVAEWFELLLEGRPPLVDVPLVVLAALVKGQPQLLDGRDDDLVGVIVGQKAADQRRGVGVFLDAAFLKAVEFLAGLAV